MKEFVQLKISLKIDIPEGALFYPCCGMDTRDPILTFMGSLADFHFSDIRNIGLPCLRATSLFHRQIDTVFRDGEFQGSRSGELAIM